MRKQDLKSLVPGTVVALALAFAVGAGAQAPAPAAATPAVKSTEAAPMPDRGMAGHHHGAVAVKGEADMKAECEAMAAKKQQMMDKVKAMDATLDKLVAEMNAAKGSTAVGAMEKATAAVVLELVAQRKAMHSMMMEMQPGMMAHMAHHGQMQGMKGGMDCPMMKAAGRSEASVEESTKKK